MSTTKIVYVRARAWLVLIALLLAIAFYFIFTVVKNDTVNLINLIFMSTIGIATHFAMFPEGENYGQTTTVFVNNKLAYNSRAVAVNENRAVKELREYCEIEYTERRERYIRNQLGIIGITYEEYEEFKTLSPKEISKLQNYEINGKLIFFTKQTRKLLKALLFKKIPVEKNDANSILSACEIDYKRAIKDGTKTYVGVSHFAKIMYSTLISLFLAYVGWTFRDGITLETIATVSVFVASMVITAIFSFSAGEKGITKYKNKYYVELSIYLDCFIEWVEKTKQLHIEIKKPNIEIKKPN